MATETAKPQATPGPKPRLDRDHDLPAMPPPKPRPSGLQTWTLLLCVVLVSAAILVAGLSSRFELIASPRSENAVAYRIDRLTGQVMFCSPAQCVPVAHRPEGAAPPQP